MRIFVSVVVALALTGCRHSFYREGDFPSVPKADAHVHISTTNGFLEEQAKKDNFILLAINVDAYDSAALEMQYKAASRSASVNPGKVFFLASFHFDTLGWGTPGWSRRTISKLSGYLEGNPVGIKIWKNIGMTVRDRAGRFIMADNPLLEPLFSFIISKGLPVTAHLGEPRNCWLPLDQMTIAGDSSYYAMNPVYHMYLHKDYPSYEDQINARDSLLARHPDMELIGCHLGSLEYSVDELAERLDIYPNLAVDLAARVCHLQYQAMKDYRKVRNFCIKYQDRLLYGTDLSDLDSNDGPALMKRVHQTWTDDWKFFVSRDRMKTWNFRGSFKGLHLPRVVVDKIFFKNTVKWYKLKDKGLII
ncbi:MAG TPA: amidohydrolase family protein [Bacteroidales bacterium]|nr:amidohydrolase family protein [Bacteroidales bacterium]